MDRPPQDTPTDPVAPLRWRRPTGVAVPGFAAVRGASRGGLVLLVLAAGSVALLGGLLALWHVLATAEVVNVLPPVQVAEELVRHQRIRVRRVYFDIPKLPARPEPEPVVVVRGAPPPLPEVEERPEPEVVVTDLMADAAPMEAVDDDDCDDEGTADLGAVLVSSVQAVGVIGEGQLFVSSQPWSQVYVDGSYTGRSHRKYTLKEGVHVVNLEAPDGRTAEVEVVVADDETTRLCWDFEADARCERPKRVKDWE